MNKVEETLGTKGDDGEINNVVEERKNNSNKGTEPNNDIRYEKGSNEFIKINNKLGWWNLEMDKDIFGDFWKTWFSQLKVRLVPTKIIVEEVAAIDNNKNKVKLDETAATTAARTKPLKTTYEKIVNFNHLSDHNKEWMLQTGHTIVTNDDHQIIFASEDCRLIGKEKVQYVAVLDMQTYPSPSKNNGNAKYRRRAFVGQCVTSRGREHIVGGICYFHEDGIMDGPVVIVAGGSLFDCDWRDSRPSIVQPLVVFDSSGSAM